MLTPTNTDEVPLSLSSLDANSKITVSSTVVICPPVKAQTGYVMSQSIRDPPGK